MPLHFCHLQAPHKKLRLPEWYISSLMLDRALDAVVRRVKNLDRKHDIPYLAGYSNDGKIIYIDRHMPATMKFRGREIDTDRFLILHDRVRRREVGLTGTEADNVDPGGLEGFRLGVDRERRGRRYVGDTARNARKFGSGPGSDVSW